MNAHQELTQYASELPQRRRFGFIPQLACTVLLFATAWCLYHYSVIEHGNFYVTKHVVIYPLFVYCSVAITLFATVYYATSFEVLPFNILLPFLRKSWDAGAATRRPSTLPDPAPDVDAILNDSASAAESLAIRMERKINLHLGYGVITGGLGLVVWYVTFYHSQTPSVVPSPNIGIRLLETLPRLTILFFIEVLAGFFLRQYRIGVEDLKYFLDLKRRADGRRIAYAIFQEVKDPESKLRFATQLLNERLDTRLAENETTTSLQAAITEKNEMVNSVETVAATLAALARTFNKKSN